MEKWLTQEDTRQLVHDLRGPLLSIEGFAEELSITAGSLLALLKHHEASLPEELVVELGEMLSGDFAPCLHFLVSAANQMENRLDEVVHSDTVVRSDVVGFQRSPSL